MNAMDKIIEVYAFLKIVLSPTGIAALVALVINYNWPGTEALVAGFALVFIGFMVGLFWAVKVQKTKGSASFLGRYL